MGMKGKLAICSQNALGLITHDEPQQVDYPDNFKAHAYVGIHLTDAIGPIGSAWSSRTPKIVGEITRDGKIVMYSQTEPRVQVWEPLPWLDNRPDCDHGNATHAKVGECGCGSK